MKEQQGRCVAVNDCKLNPTSFFMLFPINCSRDQGLADASTTPVRIRADSEM
jgi:hypothetical protein